MENSINRRDFLRRLGIGAAGVTAVACSEGVGTIKSKSSEKVMEYRINNESKDKVSLLGYGCMRWPEKEENDVKEYDQEMINKLIDYALEHGVNYFDTAPVYCQGQSEKLTGIALSRHPRDSYFLATKLSNFDESIQTFEGSKAMFENSLVQLQTDYIDYLLLHNIGPKLEVFEARFIDNGILDWLVEQKKIGRIRNLGFSFHGSQEMFEHLMAMHDSGAYHWDFVQIQMNYMDWNNAKRTSKRNCNASYLYGELEKRGISVVIMEPLLGGKLAKVGDGIVTRLKQRRPDKSVASWAFRFCGTFPSVMTILSGMTYMEHLQDNLDTFCGFEPCSQEDLAFLEETTKLILDFPTIDCTDCKYCMPCPYGLDIPAIFAHYNKCVNADNIPQSTETEGYRKARRAFLVGYDRSVPKLRQANHCIGCGQCEPHCPQAIKISHQMHKIDHYVEKLKREKF